MTKEYAILMIKAYGNAGMPNPLLVLAIGMGLLFVIMSLLTYKTSKG